MRIVIIEDENALAMDLAQTLVELDASIEIVSILKSVEDGQKWFASNPLPDLIFSDIQLGDGLSFEILGSEFVPVIFCTAYDEYALNAFHANGIDYILKPFSSESVDAALQKFRKLTKVRSEGPSVQYESIKRLLSEMKSPKPSSILIQYRDIIKPLKIDNIALFRLENGNVHIITFEQEKYYPGKSLEELEEIVGGDFFRVNRQMLVHRKAILTASSIFSRKLSLNISIPVDEGITISKEKAPAFLKWLSEA